MLTFGVSTSLQALEVAPPALSGGLEDRISSKEDELEACFNSLLGEETGEGLVGSGGRDAALVVVVVVVVVEGGGAGVGWRGEGREGGAWVGD